MNKSAKTQKKTTWNYKPGQREVLKLSRSRIDLFMDCRRCFWLLIRQNVKKPSMPGFLLNETVDHLLKKEFDIYRQEKKPHPIMKKAKEKMIPFEHDQLDTWRETFKGIEYLVEEYNFLITGIVDDIWQRVDDQKLVVADYKATSKDQEITALYKPGTYHDAYRHQVEVYQWLLLQNGFEVSSTAYFVYANGCRDKEKFGNKISFKTNLIAYKGQTDWIDSVLEQIYECLQGDLPAASATVDKYGRPQYDCEHCAYVHRRLSLSMAKAGK